MDHQYKYAPFFGELVDRLQLSLFSISFLDYPKLSLIIYFRK
jgi:hypothetical protein